MNDRDTAARPPIRMDPGELTEAIAGFEARLLGLRHTALTIKNYADSARHFAAWMGCTSVRVGDLDWAILARFAAHTCRCGGSRHQPGISPGYARRAGRFLRYLADIGLAPGVIAPRRDGTALAPLVSSFRAWFIDHRGVVEMTADRNAAMVMRLLPDLGDDPSTYNARAVREAVLRQAEQHSAAHVKTMTTALRAYLRFLAVNGLCQPGLDYAVPTIPSWRLSALPRYLIESDVERLIAACDLSKSHGVRDRAILLLLARLGLRAGDIHAMRIDDCDWAEATLRVRGKGRREIRLPLPQDAGDAVIAYLLDGRPAVDSEILFHTSRAPYGPLTRSFVAGVVRCGLRRAGITNAPSKGANLLRHSAATAMLRSGATLDTVGAILRHRAVDTTAHYAKVDFRTLEMVAQPWPGATS